MKKIVLAFAGGLVAVIAAGWLYLNRRAPKPQKPIYTLSIEREAREGQLLVEFKRGATEKDRRRVTAMLQAEVAATLEKAAPPGYRLESAGPAAPASGELDLLALKGTEEARARFAPTMALTNATNNRAALTAALARLGSDPAVQFAQPNYVYDLTTQPPNDDFYKAGKLWSLYGDGSPKIGANTSAYGTQAEKAWANGHTGANTVYVAVLDSGIDAGHPDLAANIDTSDAADFVRNRDDPNDAPFVNKDEIGHGTHVAGIIGAIGNNSIGVVGVNWSVRLIPVKIARPGVKIDTGTAATAFDYLVGLRARGLNVVAANVSWAGYQDGQPTPDYFLLRSIKNAARAGILCIASASNETNDNDKKPAYPASFDTQRDTADGSPAVGFDSIISVAALAKDGTLASFSNFGAKSVHIAAPGVGIVSTVPPSNSYFATYMKLTSTDGSTYVALDGTSMAAPHVTGAAALYAATHPGTGPADIRKAILTGAKPTPALSGKVATGGRLDLSQF